ncbi:uncharacterized protein LOC111626342 [Centruroides sculpturatus]|uniref:uncharacterized protein LOC111626342 n=1 Tax=Centruroides sculpturatus TaxID=218467 RepID=UPI000C6E3E8C|nr:uncharacterized protein LOC111626342 [Centruroides sculpturatus]
MKFKKVLRAKRIKRWNLEKLNGNTGLNFKENLEYKLKELPYDFDCEFDPNEKWKRIKDTIKKLAEIFLGYVNGVRIKKPWVTQEMIEKMDERRNWKNINNEKGRMMYKKLNNELRRETGKAREAWLSKECEEIEELNKKGRYDLSYKKVKELTNDRTHQILSIEDKDGKALLTPTDIMGHWKEYIGDLYGENTKPKELKLEKSSQIANDERGPIIMKDEVGLAIKELKNKKSEGVDGIPAEFLKGLGKEGIEKITDLCNLIYKTGEWPEDFAQSILIPIPKKAKAKKCSDFRTISLISHASKILLKIINRRLYNKAETFLCEEQFGFRKGTRPLENNL